jgi:D-aminoacyl-tRNA deacylase
MSHEGERGALLRVLVTSEKDLASLTIRKILIDEFGFSETGDTFDGNPVWARDGNTKLVTSARDLIFTNHLDDHFDSEAYIFCSRHRSKSGRPALLTHSTGNLGSEARFGGDPSELSISTASLVSRALESLQLARENYNLAEFDVSMEATHHGPTSMDTPLVFIELGSDETCWKHKGGAKAVANAAVDCSSEQFSKRASIGIGGTHYVSKFNKMVLRGEAIFGHMAPKYALENMTEDVAKQMINRCHETIESAIIDWKGTNSSQRDNVLPLLEKLDIEVIRARNV